MPDQNPHTDNVIPFALSQRPEFTAAQLRLAKNLGRVTKEQRAHRPLERTIPIDAIDPHVVSDRDDGIFVETTTLEDGGYRVHITIADVAGHVPLKSDLAQTAIARSFTVYGPGWTDPMFPKNLETLMSLEHQQERLGFTVSIDLDKDFSPRHTDLRPITTMAECMSYGRVAERMATDNQLQQMAQIATGIRQHYFGKWFSGQVLADSLAKYDQYATASTSTHKAMEMVATYMLLANHCVAAFFDRSELPFVFRNFANADKNARAFYSPRNLGHDALRRDMGLNGPYAHFTSPIRRAADFLNAHMAHFAFDALQETENDITHRHPQTKSDALHRSLWQRGPELLRTCAFGEGTPEARQSQQQATDILATLLTGQFGIEQNSARQTATHCVKQLARQIPPLSHEETAFYAGYITGMSRAPEIHQLAKDREVESTLTHLSKGLLASMDEKSFTAMLKRAASTGKIPRLLYNEALVRINEGRADYATDGFIILMVAAYPEIPRWNMLKRAVLKRIKHTPVIVNNILSVSKEVFNIDEPPVYHQDNSPTGKGPHVDAAIVTLRHEARLYTAPFYSVGHNNRAARSHARYAFLEHFAFGELLPIEQISMPNVMYAELESNEKSRRLLVENMVSQEGGNIKIQSTTTKQGTLYNLTVSGGAFEEPISIVTNEATPEEAENAAYRRLLRNPLFKHAVSPALDLSPILHPQIQLEKIAQQQGIEITIHPAEHAKPTGFTARIDLTRDRKVRSVTKSGPSKDRAINDAAIAALKALGYSIRAEGIDSTIRGWACEDEEHAVSAQNEANRLIIRPKRPDGPTKSTSILRRALKL